MTMRGLIVLALCLLATGVLAGALVDGMRDGLFALKIGVLLPILGAAMIVALWREDEDLDEEA